MTSFLDRWLGRPAPTIDPLAIAVEEGFCSERELAIPEALWQSLHGAWERRLAEHPGAAAWSPEERRYAESAFRRYAECMHFHGALQTEHRLLRLRPVGRPSEAWTLLHGAQGTAIGETEELFHVRTHQSLLGELKTLAGAAPENFPSLRTGRYITQDRAMVGLLGLIIHLAVEAYQDVSGAPQSIHPMKTSINPFKPVESFRGFEERHVAKLKEWKAR